MIALILIFASKILMMLGMAAFLTIDSLNMILSTISSRGLEMMHGRVLAKLRRTSSTNFERITQGY